MNILIKSLIGVCVYIMSGLFLSAIIDDDLHVSIYRHDLEEVKNHLQNGANPSEGLTYAIQYKDHAIINLLLEKGAEISESIFKTAIYQNDLEIINLFLEKGTKLNENVFEEIDFDDIIEEAVEDGKFEIAKLLLSDIHIISNLRYVYDVLIDVINQEWIDTVKILLDQSTKLDIEERTKGFLYAATLKNGESIMNLIKSYGINSEAILQSKVRQLIANDNLNGLIIMNKSAELDLNNLQIIKDLISSNKYDFIKYCLDNISDEIKSKIDFSDIIISLLEEDDCNENAIHLLMNFLDLKKSEDIEELLFQSARQGIVELIKSILEERGKDITMENKEEAFAIAYKRNHTKITDLLIEYGVDPHESIRAHVLQMLQDDNIDALLEKFISKEIDCSKPNIIKTIFRSGEYKLIKYLFENVPELENAFLIGVGYNPNRTGMTYGLLRIIVQKIQHIKNAYYVDISLETLEDEDIMQKFSGFINPGGGDSYPIHDKPFNLQDMDPSSMIESEKIYQKVLEVVKKYDIPYLGICAGAQNLVLKSGGFLKKGGHGGDIKIELFAGTVPHYFFLNEKEKGEMLAECKHGNIILEDAPTAHGYAGYIENLGEGVKLAGLSKEGIPEAFSLEGNKIGLQFHPEFAIEDAVSPNLHRYHQFYDSVLAMFEGYYHSMQYAKKKGIDKEVTKAAFRRVNEELIEHLENCMKKNAKKDIGLHGKNQIRNYSNSTKSISFLPGITPEDIAITRDGDKNLKIYFKDGNSGQLVLLDRYDSSYLKNNTRLEFADGSVIELDQSRIPLDQSLSGEDFLETNI